MIEGQNVETAVEWAKCFPCQNDTAETLLSSEKLLAIFKNLAGFPTTDVVPSRFLWIKSIKKEEPKSTIKNYSPKHHNSCTGKYGSNMLARAQKNAEKFKKIKRVTTH